MVSGIGSAPASAPLRAAQTAPASADGASATDSYDEQLQGALQALKSLSQNNSNANEARRSADQQTLETLKAEPKSLMMFVGDPKQRAQEAAAIAKQIAAAVQDYAQAGGDSGDATTTATPTTTTDTSTANAGAQDGDA